MAKWKMKSATPWGRVTEHGVVEAKTEAAAKGKIRKRAGVGYNDHIWAERVED